MTMHIKKCPLCASQADLGQTMRGIHRFICICRECGYYGPVRFTRRGAIRAWNKRKETHDV